MDILEINDLKTYFFKDKTEIRAVDGIRLKVPESSIFAVVGESGCGKTTLGLSVTNLISPRDGRIISGSVIFEGRNIARLNFRELRDIRGSKISYIFQEPVSSLNPVFTIGEQIGESLLVHRLAEKINVKDKVIGLLKDVGLPDAERIYKAFPHQLSGGMNQRAMIAMAIATRPRLLIADEPTTALDVDTEAQILELLLMLRKGLQLSILLITHDMRMVRRIADKTAVMYQGKIVEVGDTKQLFERPHHPYTQMLLDSMPERLKI